MGTETEASWKDQDNCREPYWRGMEQDPKQGRGAPPAVRRSILETGAEEVAVA